MSIPHEVREPLFEEIFRTSQNICLITNSRFAFGSSREVLKNVLVARPRDFNSFNIFLKRAIFLKSIKFIVLDVSFQEKDYFTLKRQIPRMEYYLTKCSTPLLLNISVGEGSFFKSCSNFPCLESVNFKQTGTLLEVMIDKYKFQFEIGEENND